MSDELSRNEKQDSKSAVGKDISLVLRGWAYEPGVINVRKVNGVDGLPKLQMRLDLGLLQMEMDGRPDGVRPHGHESLLDYVETLISQHRRDTGTDLGFQLSSDQCASLREEAVQYYHRYLSLFVLEDFPGVVRDTTRNLRVLDLCSKYADNEQDRLVLEQYRPYIVMMQARAQASISFTEKKYSQALETVETALAEIRQFFEQFGQEEDYSRASEVRTLKKLARDIRRKLPVNPVVQLKRKLERAVKEERYEDAAKLRDKLASMTRHGDAQNA